MTNENGESQLIQITPDGQAHYVQISSDPQASDQLVQIMGPGGQMLIQSEEMEGTTNEPQATPSSSDETIATDALTDAAQSQSGNNENESIVLIKNENDDSVIKVNMSALDASNTNVDAVGAERAVVTESQV